MRVTTIIAAIAIATVIAVPVEIAQSVNSPGAVLALR
jgi:hypothetical protein